MKTKAITTCLLTILALAATAHARIIGIETFAYPDGNIAGQSGGAFWDFRNIAAPPAHHGSPSAWTAGAGTPLVNGGQLVTNNSSARRAYNDINEADGAVTNLGGHIESVVYHRVTLTTGDVLSDILGLSIHHLNGQTSFFGKRTGSNFFGIETPGFPGADSAVAIKSKDSHVIVAKVDYPNKQLSLFIDPPATGSEPAAADLTMSFLTDDPMRAVAAVSLGSGGGGSAIRWDNLVVATTWEELGVAVTVVTTADDEDDGILGGGSGVSLREAINHSPAGSLVTFAPALSGETITLTLTLGQLVIDKSLVIEASALPDGITIDANGQTTNHRVIQIPAGHTVHLHSLTLTGGNAVGGFPENLGGGIYNDRSNLSLTNCAVTGNFASSGGGILNRGGTDNTTTLEISSSTISNNSAIFGGGIGNDGRGTRNAAVLLISSTVSGNSSGLGGGIDNLSSAGGNATLSLSSCTLSDNAASIQGGGIYNEEQSGGSSTVTLDNTIVASNSAPTGNDIRIIDAPAPTLEGVNLISDTSDSGLTPGPGLIIADPMLAPLANYGGPTATRPPLPDSPAIDAAGATALAIDQRGFPRTVNGTPDIGAAEFQGFADLDAFWATDWDQDGNPFGVEFALGTDPSTSDPAHPNNLALVVTPGGPSVLSFGRNPAANPHAIWSLTRSTTLEPGSFTEIFRFVGPTSDETTAVGVNATINADSFEITDNDPPPGRAFYRFEAILAP